MKIAASRRSMLLIALIASLPSHASADDPDESLTRVKLMSRAERTRLSKALQDFDGLDSDVRRSIRDLDARLSALEPEARNRALSVLRRYHVFYKNLPEEKRRAIDAAGTPNEKLELIAAFRAEQKQARGVNRVVADGIQVSELSPTRLRPLARELIVYFSLDPTADAKERAEFARLKNPAERRAFASKMIQGKGLTEKAEIRERIREEEAEFQDATKKVLGNPILAARLNRSEQEASKLEASGKGRPDGPRNKGGIPAKLKDVAARRPRDELIQKLDEQQVIRENDGESVDPILLEKFEAALPSWARQTFDDLPPDAAKRRLRTIYRLVFPKPEEYQPPKAPDPPAKPNRPAIPPAGGQGTPF